MTTATVDRQISVPSELPFLKAICWQTEGAERFTPEQMLSRYERGWRYRKLFDNLEGEELDFLTELTRRYQSWLQSDL